MADDYQLVMLILDKNLSEGADERKIPPSPPKPARKFFKNAFCCSLFIILHYFLGGVLSLMTNCFWLLFTLRSYDLKMISNMIYSYGLCL